MGARVGAIAAVAASLLAGCSGIDLAHGTYTFTVPGTAYVDPHTVLVRGGAVTDVWISQADRDNNYFGYTPDLPSADGVADVRVGGASRAAWDGLADGTYSVHSWNVTWDDSESWSTVAVDGTSESGWLAAVQAGQPPLNWVRYWIDGADEPFAVCSDQPEVYDDEDCWAWTPTS